ncbi:MAG: hypothetical protein Kow009_05750 [Spirochaetales bacterium]
MGKLQTIVGNNIKRARLRLHLSQSQLAERSGLSASFIGEIEGGKKFPSAENLERIAKALGLKPYQLLYEEEEWEVYDKYSTITSLYQELREKLNTDLEETIRKHITGS